MIRECLARMTFWTETQQLGNQPAPSQPSHQKESWESMDNANSDSKGIWSGITALLSYCWQRVKSLWPWKKDVQSSLEKDQEKKPANLGQEDEPLDEEEFNAWALAKVNAQKANENGVDSGDSPRDFQDSNIPKDPPKDEEEPFVDSIILINGQKNEREDSELSDVTQSVFKNSEEVFANAHQYKSSSSDDSSNNSVIDEESSNSEDEVTFVNWGPKSEPDDQREGYEIMAELFPTKESLTHLETLMNHYYDIEESVSVESKVFLSDKKKMEKFERALFLFNTSSKTCSLDCVRIIAQIETLQNKLI